MSKTIKEWSEEIRKLVDEKFERWLSWENLPKGLTYLHSEVSEAFEAWRDDNHEGVGEELADLFIRLLDTADVLGYDLEKEVSKKMSINWTRPKRHNKKNI